MSTNWLNRVLGSDDHQSSQGKDSNPQFGMNGAWINREPPGIHRNTVVRQHIDAPTFHGIPSQIQHSTT